MILFGFGTNLRIKLPTKDPNNDQLCCVKNGYFSSSYNSEHFECTCGQVSSKELPELRLLIDSVHEEFFVGVFESKVEGLCGEVPHHVDHIATPETQETLLFLNTTVRHNSVQIINCPRFLLS